MQPCTICYRGPECLGWSLALGYSGPQLITAPASPASIVALQCCIRIIAILLLLLLLRLCIPTLLLLLLPRLCIPTLLLQCQLLEMLVGRPLLLLHGGPLIVPPSNRRWPLLLIYWCTISTPPALWLPPHTVIE